MGRRILIALFCAMVAAWWAENTHTGRMFVMELDFAVQSMQITAEVYWEHYIESD